MLEDTTTPRPWVAVPWHAHGLISVCGADDVVVAECSGIHTAANAALIVRAVNAHDDLVAACEAWDQGFVDGEDFDADQFLAWVNRNRRLARAALAKAGKP